MKKTPLVLFAICSIVVGLGQQALAQDNCWDTVKQYVEKGLYNTYNITKTSDVKADFENWFFSQSFQQDIQNNAQGLSVTVPIEGVPVTFGGTNQSSDAWQKYSDQSNHQKWDFSHSTLETNAYRTATTADRQLWLQALQTCAGGLTLSTTAVSSTGAQVNLSYLAPAGTPVPTVLEFVCGGGLSCADANAEWKNKQIVPAGMAVNFSWLTSDSSDGTVSVNTTQGTSTTARATRTIYSPTANLRYFTRSTQEVQGSAKTADFSIANRGNQNCSHQPCYTDPRHTFQASDGDAILTADAEGELRNAQATCVSGACAFCHNDGKFVVHYFDANGNEIGGTTGQSVRVYKECWGDDTNWHVTAESWVRSPDQVPTDHQIPLAGDKLVFSVPKAAQNAQITVTANGQQYAFVPGQLPGSLPIHLQSAVSGPADTQYTYSLKTQ